MLQIRKTVEHQGMTVRSLVLRHGDAVSGHGRLVHTPAGDWFDPPLPVDAIGYAGGPPAPQPSVFAIPVEGADFEQVRARYERDGCIEGYATIGGYWLDDRIQITHQDIAIAERDGWPPQWSEPPCPAPPGGWPNVDSYSHNLAFDIGGLQDSGAAVSVVTFRPSEEQAVLVVAATDIGVVETHLRPQLGDALCVVSSRWTKQQLDEAQRHLTRMSDPWQLYAWGPRVDEQAQSTMHAALVRVTDEIADWVEMQPEGLVTPTPCLAPRRRDTA